MLPWDANSDGFPDDERIAFVVDVGGTAGLPSMATTRYGWPATGFKVFDNETGVLETTVATPYGSYGAVIDAAGILWSAIGAENPEVMRIDTKILAHIWKQSMSRQHMELLLIEMGLFGHLRGMAAFSHATTQI